MRATRISGRLRAVKRLINGAMVATGEPFAPLFRGLMVRIYISLGAFAD
jgi:hypothetical protein